MKIDNLEDYVICLGVYSAALMSLHNDQKTTINKGILSDDEIGAAETITHEINRLLTVINDQCVTVARRSPDGWDGLFVKIKQRLLHVNR
jgi:hypothetical protein